MPYNSPIFNYISLISHQYVTYLSPAMKPSQKQYCYVDCSSDLQVGFPGGETSYESHNPGHYDPAHPEYSHESFGHYDVTYMPDTEGLETEFQWVVNNWGNCQLKEG